MVNFSRLGLGTAQFGFDYGVANFNGQLSALEISKILTRAASVGVGVLDTAPAYGESEQILGACLKETWDFRLITKTTPIKQELINESHIRDMSQTFENSLTRLNRNQIDTLMVHHAEDILARGGVNIFKKMQEWKQEGKIKKIGVSVYDSIQIERIYERWHFDVVQLPISVYDQRLIQDGSLKRLASAGVEVHARSIFLQGILLMSSAMMPSYFSAFTRHHNRYLSFLNQSEITAVEAAIAFVKNCSEITNLIIGVSSEHDFDECIAAFASNRHIDLAEYAIRDVGFIDPRRWPSRNL
jgi:aryl-alcohol dehydrogenase-like predicted oxidoreductase